MLHPCWDTANTASNTLFTHTDTRALADDWLSEAMIAADSTAVTTAASTSTFTSTPV